MFPHLKACSAFTPSFFSFLKAARMSPTCSNLQVMTSTAQPDLAIRRQQMICCSAASGTTIFAKPFQPGKSPSRQAHPHEPNRVVRFAEANGAMQDGVLDLAKIGLRLLYYVYKVILPEPLLRRQGHKHEAHMLEALQEGPPAEAPGSNAAASGPHSHCQSLSAL